MGRKKIQKSPKEAKGEQICSDQQNNQATKGHKAGKEIEKVPKKRGPKPKAISKQKQCNEGAQQKNGELFPQNFRQKINIFQEFYKEYLEIKASNNDCVDIISQLNKARMSVRDKMEEACIELMHKDIDDAINWIEEKQETLQEQISQVQSSGCKAKQILRGCGTFFSQQQINNKHGEAFRNKKLQLESQVEGLEQTKVKAIQIWQPRQ